MDKKGTRAVGKVRPHIWQPCQGAKLLATMLLLLVVAWMDGTAAAPANAFSAGAVVAAASPACVRVAHVHATVQHERLASNPHHHTAATNILASTCSKGQSWGCGRTNAAAAVPLVCCYCCRWCHGSMQTLCNSTSFSCVFGAESSAYRGPGRAFLQNNLITVWAV